MIIGSPNRAYGNVEMVGGAYIFIQSQNYGSENYTQEKLFTYYISSTQTRFGCSLASYDQLMLIGGCFNDPKCKYLFFFPLHFSYYFLTHLLL